MADWRIIEGDCVEAMAAMDEASVDAVVCDPPYGLEFMGKEWDKLDRHGPASFENLGERLGGYGDGARGRSPLEDKPRWSTMGRTATLAMQNWHEAWAREALRVLKPGGHLLAFGGTRTYHRLACAIEDAGFEIRDCLAWLYGSGFPKSLDVSKAIDKRQDWTLVERLAGEIARARAEARLSLAAIGDAMQAATSGQYGKWYHRGGHMFFETGRSLPSRPEWDHLRDVLPIADEFRAVYDEAERDVIGRHNGVPGMSRDKGWNDGPFSRGEVGDITAPATPDAERWQGWGTALKPAHEPIVMARKPLSGTVAANVLEHGTGALNVDGCRIDSADQVQATAANRVDFRPGQDIDDGYVHGTGREYRDGGRWPANVVLDEQWEPIGRLTYNVSADAHTILSEWCDAHNSAVPTVRGRSRRAAEPGEASPFLLARLSGGVDERERAGRGAPDEGPATLGGEPRADATDESGEGEARPGQSAVEGRALHGPRLRDGEAAGQPARGGGASDRNGAGARAFADSGRVGASPERDQDGQSSGESRGTYEGRAHAAARGSLSGVARASRARREVLLRDVPEQWLRFFEFTGDVARCGSAEILDEQTGELATHGGGQSSFGGVFGNGEPAAQTFADSGGASRFLATFPADTDAVRWKYQAKASSAERNAGLDGFEAGQRPLAISQWEGQTNGSGETMGASAPQRNVHPTVKPIELMRWLIRLVTPPGGIVLDPFAGSGTTGAAAVLEGFRFVGIEREPEYARIAEARIAWWAEHPEGMEIVKALEADRERRAVRETGQLGLLDVE